MSRSRWAVAETRWRGASTHGAGELRRLEGRLVLEPRFLPSAVSVTKCAVILLAAGMLVMAAEPARPLASPGRKAYTARQLASSPRKAHTARQLASSPRKAQATAQADQADPVVVLARGSGYGGGTDAALVRALQRRLDRAGFTPGPIDLLYGPRTEDAVAAFQRAHGLRVDGIAGPITLSALRSPSTVLYPGAGSAGPGSGQVRALQRQLRRDGYSPGPIDGRYGPLTERGVSRFQAAHGLAVDGIAGPSTFGQLKRIAAESRTASRPRPSARRTRRSRPRVTQSPTPGAPQGVGPRTAKGANQGGASWPVALALIGLVCLAALISGAEAAYRRADARGSADGAVMLGALLERRGDPAGAVAAYQRADGRGDAAAAAKLGMLLERRHDYRAALEAYTRAQRSDEPEVAELARLRARALALGLSVAGERGER
jgi:peptidoglycan hydrolase-like protein with peptidoglycan-binding domain